MNEESTITFVNTLLPEGNSRLVILEQIDGTQPVIPDNPAPNDCSSDPINTICGFDAGTNITTASNTTLFGVRAAELIETGQNNSFFGHESGKLVFGGVGNTLLGSNTATSLKSGSQNICLGNNAASAFNGVESRNIILYGPGQANDSATIRIGDSTVHVANTFIQGMHGITQSGGNILNVTVDENGHMGTDAGGILIGVTDTENSLYGVGAGTAMTSGDSNVILGFNAGNFMTTAGESVIIGAHAAENLLNAGRGIFIGANSGLNCNVTSGTIGIGFNTLQNLVSPSTGNTVAIGHQCMENVTTGGGNVGCGPTVLNSLTTGSNNCCYGRLSGTNIIGGSSNTYYGDSSGPSVTSATDNTGVGKDTMFNCSGSDNTALGSGSGGGNLTGTDNVYIGKSSGASHNGAETSNIIISSNGVSGDSTKIRIGTSGTHTNTFISGIHGVTPGAATETVIIDSNGEMGSVDTGGTTADATGVIAGGFLTINADDTKFDISDGNGIIYNPVTEVKTLVSWSGLTAQSIVYVGDETFISINSAGTLSTSPTLPTNTAIRADIYLGQIVHLNQTNIVVTLDEQMTLLSGENQIRDFMQAIGELKINGNILSSNSLLTIAKTAGNILKFGGNFSNDVNNPHLPISGTLDTNVADTFAYRWQDGSNRLMLTSIVPGEFDDGNGEAAPGTVMANQWSVQRVFTFSIGQMVIQQAQFVYGNENDAIANIQTEGFVIESDLAVSGVLIGFLAVKGNASDLSSVDATFLEAGKFGGTTVGTAAGVNGPASSTDNAIARWDTTTGTIIQNSSVIIDDSNNVSGIVNLTATGIIDLNSVPSFDLVTTSNTSTALQIQAQGGVDAELHINNTTGTTGDSIRLLSSLGGIDIDCNQQINIESQQASNIAIHIHATNAAGGVDLQSGASGTIEFRAGSGGVRIDNGDLAGLIFDDSTSAFDLNLKSSSLQSETYDMVLPPASATVNGQVLSSTTAGITSWETVSSGLPAGYLSGFAQINTSTTVITFGTSGEVSVCRDTTNVFDLQWASTTETITTSVTGVGGITDTQNPVAANQGYEVYIVGDTTLSTATDILAVEAGTVITTVIEFTGGDFDVFRRIGWFVTQDGSTAIIPHTVGGKSRPRQLHYTGGRNAQAILIGGSATTFTDMASGGNGSEQYTAPGSHHMVVRIAFGDTAASNEEVAFRQNGSTTVITDALYTFSAGSALSAGELADSQLLIHFNTTDRITEYIVSSASNEAFVYVVSFNFGI